MEASKFLPEGDPYSLEIVALIVPIEGSEPVYRFFVDEGAIEDVGVTREFCDEGLVTYNFFNNYKQFAAADIIVGGDIVSLEWFGPEGSHQPQEYLDILPKLVDAAVYADYGVSPVAGSKLSD